VRKRAVPVPVTFARSSGTLETLEGPVPYEVGDAIVTGTKGESWPVGRSDFLDRYAPLPGTNPGDNGTYERRPEVLDALQVTDDDNPPLEVTIASGGVLTARTGDWIVQYSTGDLGVVNQQIFKETYEVIS
jgi:PGDYG protein